MIRKILRRIFPALFYTPGPGPKRPGSGATQAQWDAYRTHYDRQIDSGSWDDTRRAAKHRARDRCQRCGAAKGDTDPEGQVIKWLEVHHLHYDTFGAERPQDLKVVCPCCHRIEDELRKRKRGR